jgi:hypothetical protein
VVFGRVKLETLFSHVSETSYSQKIAYCRNEPLPASAGCHEAMKEQHVLGGGGGRGNGMETFCHVFFTMRCA